MSRSQDVVFDFSAVRGRHVLIALSGGADSTALACLLAEARDSLSLTLSAAHLDHGIRRDSDQDARFCEALCKRLDIPFHQARMDVPALVGQTHEGLETAARRERYAWLRQIKTRVHADVIALAHHMDDQAETVLMHLLRGAGPAGIGGMADLSGDLYRPLLGVRKQVLVDYLSRRGIPWREDVTNAVADTPRNALRLHVMPELEQSYPQAVAAIARYARLAREESDYVGLQADLWLKGRLREGPFGRYLSLEGDRPTALLRRALRELIGDDALSEDVAALEALCLQARGRICVSGGQRVERGHRGLYFLREDLPHPVASPLSLTGDTRLEGLCRITARPDAPTPCRDDPMCQVLRRDALKGAVVRTRRSGDRIRPLGAGDKLLSDYLTDRKVDRPVRDCLALVAVDERVMWVCGVGIAQEAALRGGADAVRLACRYDAPMILQ